jgi:hypothetical protein
MNDNSPQIMQEPPKEQEKVATSVDQQNVAINVDQKETHEDPDWRAFREARKKDIAEREAAIHKAQEKEAEVAALKAAMEAAFSKSQPQQQQYAEQGDETEDERIEKKVTAAIAKRDAEYRKTQAERERTELPDRLAKAFPDYGQVVNEENGAYLEYHHPELYRTLMRQPENFDTCSDIYKLVKKYVPNATTAKREMAKADANVAKPKSISSIGMTQPGEAKTSVILSEERKAANYARMQKVLKGLS